MSARRRLAFFFRGDGVARRSIEPEPVVPRYLARGRASRSPCGLIGRTNTQRIWLGERARLLCVLSRPHPNVTTSSPMLVHASARSNLDCSALDLIGAGLDF